MPQNYLQISSNANSPADVTWLALHCSCFECILYVVDCRHALLLCYFSVVSIVVLWLCLLETLLCNRPLLLWIGGCGLVFTLLQCRRRVVIIIIKHLRHNQLTWIRGGRWSPGGRGLVSCGEEMSFELMAEGKSDRDFRMVGAILLQIVGAATWMVRYITTYSAL